MTDAEPERVDVAPRALAWTERLAPYAQHGPLPLVLLGLTVVTGVVDAVSYIALGHVFVGNMTGNIVLLGFALAGAPGLSVAASLTALAAFLVGAGLGGALGRRIPGHRGAFARTGVAAEVALLAVAFVVALNADPATGGRRYAVIVVLAVALGGQNAVARRIAVPDLTTTVVTLTLTALVADTRLAGGPGHASARRIAAVVAMFLGALAGGLLTVHVSSAAALALATATAAVVALGAHRTARSREGWALRRP